MLNNHLGLRPRWLCTTPLRYLNYDKYLTEGNILDLYYPYYGVPRIPLCNWMLLFTFLFSLLKRGLGQFKGHRWSNSDGWGRSLPLLIQLTIPPSSYAVESIDPKHTCNQQTPRYMELHVHVLYGKKFHGVQIFEVFANQPAVAKMKP